MILRTFFFLGMCMGFMFCSGFIGEVIETWQGGRLWRFWTDNKGFFVFMSALNILAVGVLVLLGKSTFQNRESREETDVRWRPWGITFSMTDFIQFACFFASYILGFCLILFIK